MKLTMITWAGVRVGGPVPACQPREVTAELDGLLSEHVQQLLRRMREGSTPAAEFTSDEARMRFDRLAGESADEFGQIATWLAVALQTRMDKRTHDGLLVAARLIDLQSEPCVGVFKLDITDQLAGFIEDSPTGEQVLHAVRNVLETPGKLQKGAVVPDLRSISEVVVGDKLPDTAQYFLDALGIRQVQRPTQAPRELVDVVTSVTGKTPDDIVVALQQSDATTPAEFLRALPEVSPRDRTEVLGRLERLKRPIRQVDTRAVRGLRKVLKGSGITISGLPQEVISRVEVSERPDGKWQVTIVLDERPRESYE